MLLFLVVLFWIDLPFWEPLKSSLSFIFHNFKYRLITFSLVPWVFLWPRMTIFLIFPQNPVLPTWKQFLLCSKTSLNCLKVCEVYKTKTKFQGLVEALFLFSFAVYALTVCNAGVLQCRDSYYRFKFLLTVIQKFTNSTMTSKILSIHLQAFICLLRLFGSFLSISLFNVIFFLYFFSIHFNFSFYLLTCQCAEHHNLWNQ